MKRVISFLTMVCLLTAVLFTGCSGGDKKAQAGTSAVTSADAFERAIEERKAAAAKSGEYPTVVMAFMNWSGSPKALDRINSLLSAYTEDKLGLHVELEIMDVASYSQSLTLMLSSGEQVDLFNALLLGYTSSVNKGYCLDLEEDSLIQTYGPGIMETMGSTLTDACRIDNVLYGLPQQRDMASGAMGFAIGREYLEGIGFDYQSLYGEDKEVIHTDIATIDGIFEQLHGAYPDRYVFAPQEATLQQGLAFDYIGGDNYGVLLDPENNLEVEDLWSSDMFRGLCDLMYSWNQRGFISRDALTDDTAATVQVKAGTAMSYATATKPGIRQQESNLCGRSMIIFQTGPDMLRSASPSAMPWCVSSTTEDPVAAMQFLNACYTDPYISNLLCWGEEGKEYVKTADGHITFPEGINAQNSGYYNNVNWEMPNQFIAHIWEGDDLDIWERMEVFNNNATVSKAMGFVFDNSSVANEYTALTNVYREYAFMLMYGFIDPDEGIPTMVQKMKSAGLDKYMQAKQEALDLWAQVNGIN